MSGAHGRARRSRLSAERVSTVGAPGSRKHHVVVVGGGFGGLPAVSKLRRAPVEVTLVDRRNFHLFQPLTYQVATGALSPGEIAYPLRAIFKRNRNVRVLLAEVADFDLDARELHLRAVGAVPAPERLEYDTLIVAGGSHYSYFGHEEWQLHAAEVKSLESAIAVRSRLLAAFEAAEVEPNPAARDAWLTFIVVGAGPTGVEMAGQIAELAQDTLRRDFRTIDPRRARILLVEVADRVLTSFPPTLSAKAERSLQRLGVTVLTGRTVTGINAAEVTLEGQDGGAERIPSRAVVWAAGVVRARLRGREYGAFRYRDKGNLATIGRAAAVADIKGVRLSGFLAWATWLLVHLWYLIGFQNRLLVVIRWSFSFATHGRGARLITDASTTSEQRDK